MGSRLISLWGGGRKWEPRGDWGHRKRGEGREARQGESVPVDSLRAVLPQGDGARSTKLASLVTLHTLRPVHVPILCR